MNISTDSHNVSAAGGSSHHNLSSQVRNPEEDHSQQINFTSGGEGEESKSLGSNTGVNTSGLNLELIMKTYNVSNKIDTQKKIQEIKGERRELRVKLDDFQKQFISNNNRRIRFTKDIGPVQNEFKRYKELKSDLSKLEALYSSFH